MHSHTRLQLQPETSTQSPTLPPLPSIDLFGLPVANAPMEQALDWLCARLARGERTHVAFLNAHCVNVAAVRADYRAVLEAADVILPDGSGIGLAARLQGERLVANLNGTDLVPQLCARLSDSGQSVYLLGGKPGVAQSVAEALRRMFPELRIVGTQHGYFQPDDEDDVVAAINASGADVVLAAMGVPLQETWLHRVGARLTATMRIGVGGCFDFLSGGIPRAPAALRRLGLEWVYRLYQEPLRMWQRYILGNPAFVMRAAADALPGSGEVLRRFDLALKRLIDIGGAAVGLLIAAPLFLVVAATIRATSPGPALLRQTRIGKDGKPFALFKFRSMYVDAEARRAALEQQNQHGADGVTFKLRRDPRVTSVGRLLRRSSIDEMPQLWNVLIGDMSLVGPRPPLAAEVARYLPRQHRRLEAKPGLTCLWQVGGRADLPFERQVDLDIEYLARRNTWLDLVILLRTVPAVLTARGAY
jgi:exopolysaccharide biosynthesis WecB/TagA/CpsF family protein